MSQNIMNWGLPLLLSVLLLVTSCSKSDDLEPIFNQSPIDNEPPINKEQSVDNETSTEVESAIIYTDIEPNFTGGFFNHSYNLLDLNNDGIKDFTFSAFDDYLLIQASNSINSIISVAPWYANTVPLNSGSEIFNLSGYTNGEYYEYWAVFTTGNCFGGDKDCFYDWKNKKDKYLGLRFLINGKTHYGWVRMDVTSSTIWVVKDYAYNVKTNEPIIAGQMR